MYKKRRRVAQVNTQPHELNADSLFKKRRRDKAENTIIYILYIYLCIWVEEMERNDRRNEMHIWRK